MRKHKIIIRYTFLVFTNFLFFTFYLFSNKSVIMFVLFSYYMIRENTLFGKWFVDTKITLSYLCIFFGNMPILLWRKDSYSSSLELKPDFFHHWLYISWESFTQWIMLCYMLVMILRHTRTHTHTSHRYKKIVNKRKKKERKKDPLNYLACCLIFTLVT